VEDNIAELKAQGYVMKKDIKKRCSEMWKEADKSTRSSYTKRSKTMREDGPIDVRPKSGKFQKVDLYD
jgi:hypothetical protein